MAHSRHDSDAKELRDRIDRLERAVEIITRDWTLIGLDRTIDPELEAIVRLIQAERK
jgi:hypothetical protein